MSRNNFFALGKLESWNTCQLLVNVLLVFYHEGFTCQHVLGWCVRGTNINNRQSSTDLEESLRFLDDSRASLLWHLVKAIHNGDKIEVTVGQPGVF